MDGIWIGGMLIMLVMCVIEFFNNPVMAVIGILFFLFFACIGGKTE